VTSADGAGDAAARYAGLIDGRARFAADLVAPGALHLAFVRSQFAHARIVSIDVSGAVAAPGVAGVFTADDLDLVPIWEIELIPEEFAQPPLARDVVRHVGERVVAVVADSLTAAIDATELVVVEYEPLDVLADAAASIDGPPMRADRADNVALEWDVEAGAVSADVVTSDAVDVSVSGRVAMPRIAVAPMEGLSIVAVPERDGRLTLHTSTQAPRNTRIQTARSLGVSMDHLRVVVPSVGGAFGGKSLGGIAEYVVTAAIARRLGRPVRYHEDRGSNLTSMHGRGVELSYTMHATSDGRILSLDVQELCDAGAYPQTNAVEPGKTSMMLCGPYRVPAARFRARSVTTNRAPSGAYRGPGRSESTAMLEQALDRLAERLGLDPVEVRRRNLLRRDELPCVSITGAHYDEVDHHALLDALVEHAGLDALRAEQARRRATPLGTQIGIGIATVVDSTAWFARTEPIRVVVEPGGTVRVLAATASAGQVHGAAFRSILRALLPLDGTRIDVVEGDTDHLEGTGTSGSRSVQLAASAVQQAGVQLLQVARELAAELLEAAPGDVVAAADRFTVRGTPSRGVTWADLAASAFERRADGSTSTPLDASCVFEQETPTYPAAAHLSVVEIDPQTGATRARRHIAVTDCGTIIDEVGARGQVVGATAQGIAQVLFEEVAYDCEGTPLATSFAEYALPAAPEIPPIEAHFIETPAVANPLGAKGVGEIGMVAAPAAVWNAVLDALAVTGVREIDIPCTPERVWRAFHHTID
jgi:aerobic carbon-monoxide dehydrogenase large subunit